MKPTGKQVAQQAIGAVGMYSYNDMDCQALVEYAVQRAGGTMDYRGSNHMARSAVWLGTLARAKAEGKLVPGAGVLIAEPDESGLPARYKGDGMGDFSHVGLYVGENALEDVDKRGRRRVCNVVHSSASMGRVAGSTLANAWTHVMLFPEIDYGANAQTNALQSEIPDDTPVGDDAFVDETLTMSDEPSPELTAGTPANPIRYALVRSASGNPVKLRKSASTKEHVYWTVNNGARVRVERVRNGWALITAICTDGRRRRAYMMANYLSFE